MGPQGFEVSPTGLYHLWGSASVTEGTPLAITFSSNNGTALPNNIRKAVATSESTAYTVAVTAKSTTGITLTITGSAGSATVDWDVTGD
jgi:hypothetical protein